MSNQLPKRIESEEEYHAMLGRLVRGADMIADPLIDDERSRQYNAVYDRMIALIDDWQARNPISKG